MYVFNKIQYRIVNYKDKLEKVFIKERYFDSFRVVNDSLEKLAEKFGFCSVLKFGNVSKMRHNSILFDKKGFLHILYKNLTFHNYHQLKIFYDKLRN